MALAIWLWSLAWGFRADLLQRPSGGQEERRDGWMILSLSDSNIGLNLKTGQCTANCSYQKELIRTPQGEMLLICPTTENFDYRPFVALQQDLKAHGWSGTVDDGMGPFWLFALHRKSIEGDSSDEYADNSDANDSDHDVEDPGRERRPQRSITCVCPVFSFSQVPRRTITTYIMSFVYWTALTLGLGLGINYAVHTDSAWSGKNLFIMVGSVSGMILVCLVMHIMSIMRIAANS